MEKITNIEIKNFKSIRHQKIDGCKRINVLVGKPNVGKSNILEALGVYSVAQQINRERFFFNSICRINYFSDLYFDKNLQNKISISIDDKYELSFKNKNSYSEFETLINLNGLSHPIFSTTIGEKYNFILSEIKDDKNSNIPQIKYYYFKNNSGIEKRKSTSLSIPNGDNLLDILHGNASLRGVYSKMLSNYNFKLAISTEEINVIK